MNHRAAESAALYSGHTDPREPFPPKRNKPCVMATLSHRRSICRWLVGVIVSAQLAVAAFACATIPGLGALDPTAANVVAIADYSGVVLGPTGGADSTSPNLCVAHCQFGQQNADSTAEVSVPVMLLTTLYTLPPLGDEPARARPLGAPLHLLAAAEPPHAILHCCWRD